MLPVLRLVIRNFVSTLDKATLFFLLIFPLFFIFVMGFAFEGIIPDFELGGIVVSYPVFLSLGAVTFTAINSGMTTGQLLWFDRKHGMFEQMLMGPFTRAEYIAGMILTTILVGLLSAGIALGLALPVLSGATLSPSGFLSAGLALTLGSLFFGSLAIILSAKLRSSESFTVVSNFIFFIFLFTSSVLYPAEKAPPAIRAISLMNPLTHIADVFRVSLLGLITEDFALKLSALIGESFGIFALAVVTFRKLKA